MMTAVLLTAGIGAVMGLLGGGGSILTVPMLIAVLGLEEREAMATSLAVVVSTALVSLIPHFRAGNVALRQGLSFAAIGAASALGGGALSRFIPGPVLLGGFALVMLATGLAMLRDRRQPAASLEQPKPLRTALAAVGAGLLTGLVGAGGGFVIVPALTLLARLPMRQAVGTSLLVIALQGAAGLVGHLGHTALDFGLLWPLAAAAAFGSLGGAHFSARAPGPLLKKAFGVLVLVVAAWMSLRTFSATAGAVAAIGVLVAAAAAWAWQSVSLPVARRL